MLYASIFLFIAGIALIVYSFLSRSSSVAKNVPMEVGVPPATDRGFASTATKKSEPAQILPNEKTQNMQNEHSKSVSDEGKSSLPPVTKPEAESVSHTQKPVVQASAEDERDSAALYHDASGVVDYEGGVSVIDPSFKKYSKLKRIGSGHVSVVGEGINFQLRKKLYRFEFYLVDRMVQGENYLALFLKGSDEARLFIFKRGSGIEKKLAREYAAYRKKQI